jgi:vacuolar-type H+-ATPase subunit H
MAGKAPGNGIADLERVFTEYRNKLEHAEKQSEEIIQRAREEADNIIARTEAEAGRLLADTDREAQGAADSLLRRANDRAAKIIGEAEGKAKKEAKQKVRQEMEKIIAAERTLAEKEAEETLRQAHREAEEIVAQQRELVKLETRTETLEIITRAREKARKVDEDSIIRAHETDQLLAEVVARCQGIVTAFKQQAAAEFGQLENVVNRAKENLKDMILAGDVAATKDVDTELPKSTLRSFKGLQEIRVLRPYRRAQIDELIRALCQYPRVRLSWESGNADYISLNMEIGEPLPLVNLLEELPQVLDCELRDNVIELRLGANAGPNRD